jgi:hypothetical protein
MGTLLDRLMAPPEACIEDHWGREAHLLKLRRSQAEDLFRAYPNFAERQAARHLLLVSNVRCDFYGSLAGQVRRWLASEPEGRVYPTPLSAKQMRCLLTSNRAT